MMDEELHLQPVQTPDIMRSSVVITIATLIGHLIPLLPFLWLSRTSVLRSAAADAGVEVTWMEQPLDAEFSSIRQRRADAGLGWMDPGRDGFPAPLEVMKLGEFEPDVWVPAAYPAAARGAIGLAELARLDVVYGPRRVSAETYDAWLAVLRAANARFEFTDPPFRHSLPITLAFAAAASRPTAVLTSPCRRTTTGTAQPGPDRSAGTYGMVPVRVRAHPLTAMAGLAWSGDLPRQLQQVLVDTAMDSFLAA
jgi:hypothetical protein